MPNLIVVTYLVTFKNPFRFNGVQYFAQVPYHFTAVAPSTVDIGHVDLAQRDYGDRFSQIYFELARPIQVVSNIEIEEE